jgi:2-octaprenylphenol hydroxylase
VLLRALFAALAKSTVDVRDDTAVGGWWEEEAQHGIILGDQQRLSAHLVIAADGPRSRLRQWAGLPTRAWDYEQEAIVCTVETSEPHQFTAWQRFSLSGPLAFLPLSAGSGHYSSIVWSQDTGEARRLMALGDTDFVRALEQAIEHQLGTIQAVSRRFAFPLQQRHAKNYTRPGLALIGDAAHSIHPLAGQGVNLGYSDVRVLLEEMQRARQANITPDTPALLARYQRRRKGENLATMAAMEGFKQLFSRDELPVRWLRNTGMRWLDGNGLLKNRIAAQAMGVQGH